MPKHDTGNYIAHVSKDGRRKQTVDKHLNGTAEYAGQVGHTLCLPELCRLTGTLHDFGKYSQEFQHYIKSATGLIDCDKDDVGALKGKIDHSTAGAQYVHSTFSRNASAMELMARDIVAICVASHHSGLLNICEGPGNYASRITKAIPDYTGNVPGTLKAEVEDLIPKAIKEIAMVFNQKMCTVGKYDPFKAQMLLRMVYSTLVDADRNDAADTEDPSRKATRSNASRSSFEDLVGKLEIYLGKFGEPKNRVDEVRARISRECLDAAKRPLGFFTLTVPTGGGKTLASLRFALNHAAQHGLERVFYIIPFTSIIDQNADVARDALDEQDQEGRYTTQNVLEQHSNLSNGKENSHRKLFAENWDAPVVFTTSVSFLESLFSAGTCNYRRTHRLSKSIIILDEVQALPPHTLTLACQALNYLVESEGCSVVLCSATQPRLYIDSDDNLGLKRGLRMPKNAEICFSPDELFRDLERTEIINRCRQTSFWTTTELGDALTESGKLHGNALCIVNTKRAAASIFAKVKGSFPGHVFHLSTNMCPAHRLERIRHIRNRLTKDRMIVVSTQLIEAGVDIDFCCVWRSIAGLDSIAQAAGRCNRNGLMEELGGVYIVNLDPSEENTESLTALELGKRLGWDALVTSKEMGRHSLGRSSIQYYFGAYYKELQNRKMVDIPINPVNAGLPGHYRANTACGLLFTEPVGSFAFSTPFKAVAEEFYVIRDLSYTVVVPWTKKGSGIIADLCSQAVDREYYNLLRQAQSYSVQLYQGSALDIALREADAIYEAQEDTGILCLKPGFYDNDMGVTRTPGIVDSLYV